MGTMHADNLAIGCPDQRFPLSDSGTGAIDSLLRSIVRGQPIDLPHELDGRSADLILRRIDYHGIALKVWARRDEIPALPDEVRHGLAGMVAVQRLWEESHRQTILELLDGLQEAGVDALVMKGTALAYSLYDEPAARRRTDTDILVRKSQISRAREVLVAQDYGRIPEARVNQETWWGETDAGLSHVIDLHWQVMNSPALNQVFDVEECFARAVDLPRLSGRTRAADGVTTFVHGCLNQVLHARDGFYLGARKESGSVRLIWEVDNFLLANSFSPKQWDDLLDIVLARELSSLCLPALLDAQQNFGVPVPPHVLARLQGAPADGKVTDYIYRSSKAAKLWSDLCAGNDFSSRLGLLQSRLFPGPDQMAERFPSLSNWPMPVLYLLRLVLAPLRVLQPQRDK